LKGIDISNYQAGIDLATLKTQGYEVVYIKATEGLTFNDKSMMAHYNNALKQGFKIGFYHYLRANDPVLEAKHFLSVINGLHSDCLYGIDAEQQSEATGISARTRAFADYLISQGKQPCLYTGLNFYNTEILPICKDIPLWVANYCLTRPLIKSVGWQCSQDGNLDQDIFDDGILLNKPTNVVLTSQPASTKPKLVANETIRQLQCNINLMKISDLVTDGLLGINTTYAIIKFQKIMNLKQDGILGPITQNAIMQILSRPTDGVLKQHFEYATRYIQWRISVAIDGTYGNGTASGVRVWQGKNNLVTDGVVGAASWKKLL